MKTPLLLFVLISVVFGAVYTIDCGTAAAIGPFVCATYQVVPPQTDPTLALVSWFNDCGNGLAAGDTLRLRGTTCVINDNLFNFPTTWSGSFTLTSETPASPVVLDLQGGPYVALITQNPAGNTNPSSLASFRFSDLIISSTTNTGYNHFFVAHFGHVDVVNVRVRDLDDNGQGSYNNLGGGQLITVYGNQDGAFTWPTDGYNLNVQNLIVSATGLTPANRQNIFAPLIGLGSGYTFTATGVTISQVDMLTFLYQFSFDPNSPSSISISGLTFNNVFVHSRTCGLILCTENGVELSDFTVDLSNIRVTNTDFASGTASQNYGLVSWLPDNSISTDGTFSLTDSNFTTLTFQRPGFGIIVRGRQDVTVSGNNFTSLAVTIPSATSSVVFLDESPFITVASNLFSDLTGFAYGAVYIGENAVDALISSNDFIDNNAITTTAIISYGGAVHLEGSAIIQSSTFTNNVAENGGAVFIGATTVVMTDCTFTDNTAVGQRRASIPVGYGGAIAKNLDGLLILETTTFTRNNATFAGGALAYITEPKIPGVIGYGGNGGDAKMTDCDFSDNTSPRGGAMFFKGRGLIVDFSNFTTNVAETGGAVSVLDVNPFISNVVLFTNCRFVQNSATDDLPNSVIQHGGAISTQRSLQLRECYFEENSSPSGNGGAITAYKGANIDNSKFIRNSASGFGGAVYSHPLQPQPLFIKDTSFDDNMGLDGGAVWTDNPQTLIQTSSFNTNNATGGLGGALYLAAEAVIADTGFISNDATDGGAIYTVGQVNISGSRFETNSASNNGGAIYCISEPLGFVDFRLNLWANFFRDNTADGIGGHVDSTCTVNDVGSTFYGSTQPNPDGSIECNGNERLLRACELTFTNTIFNGSSLNITAPTALPSGSLGLVMVGVRGVDFTASLEAETITIKTSNFERHDLVFLAPTDIEGSSFSDGNQDHTNGPTTISGSKWSGGSLLARNTSETFSLDTSESSGAYFDIQIPAVLADVNGKDNTSLIASDTLELSRVNFDASSTLTHTGTVVVHDVTSIGNLHSLSGSLTLETKGDLSVGGDGSNSTINVGFVGAGDFIVNGGDTYWTNGDILGPGAFTVNSGNFYFQAQNAAFERDAIFSEDSTPTFESDFVLAGKMLLLGGAIFGDGVTIDGTAETTFETRGNVYWGINDRIKPNYANYADMHFDIYDVNIYDHVVFERDFYTAPNTSVFAFDHRPIFTYVREHIDNERADYGRQFEIIELGFVWPIETNGTTPFKFVTYTINDTHIPQTTVPDNEHSGWNAPRVSTRGLDQNNEDATNFLYLYADGAISQIPLALFIFMMLCSLL